MDEAPTRCDYCGSPPGTRRLDDVVSLTVHRSVFDPRRSAFVHGFFCDEDHLRLWMADNPQLPFDESDVDRFAQRGDPAERSPRTTAFRYGAMTLQVLMAGFAVFGVVALVMLLT